MVSMTLDLNILKEEDDHEKKKLMDAVRYPFIKALSMNNQELTVEDMTVFIERHSGTLRTLELSGNFLEKGLFDLMDRSKILLNSFSLS